MAVAVEPRRTQQQRREATIRKLLDAATEILIEVGYAGASVQRICERAELSQGALFRQFATREQLMVAVGEDVGSQLLARYRRRFKPTAKGQPDVGAGLRLLREVCRSRLNTAWYELAMAARTNPALEAALRPVARRYFDAIVALARELLPDLATRLGPSFDVLVTSVIALFDGEVVQRTLVRDAALEDTRLEWIGRAITQLARG